MSGIGVDLHFPFLGFQQLFADLYLEKKESTYSHIMICRNHAVPIVVEAAVYLIINDCLNRQGWENYD